MSAGLLKSLEGMSTRDLLLILIVGECKKTGLDILDEFSPENPMKEILREGEKDA